MDIYDNITSCKSNLESAADALGILRQISPYNSPFYSQDFDEAIAELNNGAQQIDVPMDWHKYTDRIEEPHIE